MPNRVVRHDRSQSVRAACLGALSALLAGCVAPAPTPPRELVVSATDYAFGSVPAELSAGPVQFRMENQGKVPHEMALGQLSAGVTADSMMAYLAGGGEPAELSDGVVGILIASPGTTSLGTLAADLVSGRTYLMICQFRDSDSLPPHAAMGMIASFVAK
ncbi:MAG: hypothetical protein ABI542_03985 [Gemmatimonadota bacterium]